MDDSWGDVSSFVASLIMERGIIILFGISDPSDTPAGFTFQTITNPRRPPQDFNSGRLPKISLSGDVGGYKIIWGTLQWKFEQLIQWDVELCRVVFV
ncbi:hypothetical protein TNIN_79491 [Trichonephila inaurata madagascariensis]|uniref:Uncharacterized protein n=1 Tax=Trichonephila inaurata madagascariensis TaxID=2747483 RepID=A0A8X6XVM4_9ARAC|nr:hypothetical protein TNIN_79491 [Trichonephila inaurata madagascariensis]